MRPRTLTAALVAVLAPLVVAAPAARADDFLAPAKAAAPLATPAALEPAAALAAPAAPAAPSTSWIDLAIGAEAGGAPMLRAPDGPVAATTATRSASLFARLALPVLSSRTLELSYAPGHGAGAMLIGGDLTLGRVHLHLLDLGAFYDRGDPITVARVPRRWDLVVGAGAEVAITRRLGLVVDARLFAPADLWSVVTHYGDTARLIGSEVVDGIQVWAGADWHF